MILLNYSEGWVQQTFNNFWAYKIAPSQSSAQHFLKASWRKPKSTKHGSADKLGDHKGSKQTIIWSWLEYDAIEETLNSTVTQDPVISRVYNCHKELHEF